MLVNKTPHAIVIRLDSGNEVVIPPTFPAARVAVTTIEQPSVDGIPVSAQVFGAVENLPDAAPGVWYIVSVIVLSALSGRSDLLRPDTGPDAIRNEAGQIVAVRRLTR